MTHAPRTHVRRASAAGFTLIEMMVVISIIAVLAALVLGALSAARTHSKVQRTELVLSMLDAKIKEYERDFGDWPDSKGADGLAGSEALLEALLTEEQNGPYINRKEMDIRDTNGNGHKEFVDPWGKPIHYIHFRYYDSEPPNRDSFRLYSAGPDKEYDPDNPGSDDIVNWKKGAEE